MWQHFLDVRDCQHNEIFHIYKASLAVDKNNNAGQLKNKLLDVKARRKVLIGGNWDVHFLHLGRPWERPQFGPLGQTSPQAMFQ